MDTSKRLYRSRSERMLFGVAGGLAEYFNIDPTLVRIIFAAVTIWGGGGLLIYLVMALIVPEEPLGHVSPPPSTTYPPQSTSTAEEPVPDPLVGDQEPLTPDDVI